MPQLCFFFNSASCHRRANVKIVKTFNSPSNAFLADRDVTFHLAAIMFDVISLYGCFYCKFKILTSKAEISNTLGVRVPVLVRFLQMPRAPTCVFQDYICALQRCHAEQSPE